MTLSRFLFAGRLTSRRLFARKDNRFTTPVHHAFNPSVRQQAGAGVRLQNAGAHPVVGGSLPILQQDFQCLDELVDLRWAGVVHERSAQHAVVRVDPQRLDQAVRVKVANADTQTTL